MEIFNTLNTFGCTSAKQSSTTENIANNTGMALAVALAY